MLQHVAWVRLHGCRR